MIVIVGCIVVIGAVLTGFTMAGGQVGALIHPSEIVTIGGAAIGALIVMSPKKVLIDLIRGMLQCVKGSPYDKAAYEELFKMLYDLFRVARRDGLMALESHVTDPHESTIFHKYPAQSAEPSRVGVHLRRAVADDRRDGEAGAAARPAGGRDQA